MKTFCFLLIGLLGLSLAQINPQPMAELPLIDAQGFWYVVYYSPNPLNITNGSAINCWETQFYVKADNKSVLTINTADILGHSVTVNYTGKIANAGFSVWTYSNFTWAWLDFDVVDRDYGLIASMNSSSFFILSRDPTLDSDILQQEINIAVSQGYSTNGFVTPANNDCPY